jgi:hypothetical protein
VHGGRGEASRLGHHGITTDANGWDCGVNVDGGKFGSDDHFTIYATGGSNESRRSHKIAMVEEIDGAEYIGGLPVRMRRITLFDREGNTVMEYTA